MPALSCQVCNFSVNDLLQNFPIERHNVYIVYMPKQLQKWWLRTRESTNCSLWLAKAKYKKHTLEFLELSVFNFRACYNKQGQGWEMDPNIGKYETMFDCFVALNSLCNRFMTINHPWVLMRKHKLILYSEVFIFLMFLLQKSIRSDALWILRYFAQLEGMGMAQGNERRAFSDFNLGGYYKSSSPVLLGPWWNL